MKKNLNSLDIGIRIVLSLIIYVLGYLEVINGTLVLAGILLGSFLLFTALLGFCPLYRLFGFKTYLNLNERRDRFYRKRIYFSNTYEHDEPAT